MPGRLAIVDALNFLYRAYHALPPLATSQGVPTGAVYGLCQMLLRLEREQQPTHLCVVFDAPGRTFRDDLYAAYKAHRPPMPPDLLSQLDLGRRALAAFGLPELTVAGVEADDVIATLARQAERDGLEVVIASSDKDLMQLVGEHVRVLDTMKNRLLGPAEVEEKFGVAPPLVADVLALTGDQVDNVPGVPGVGPKTAADLIRQFGGLDALLREADGIKGKKGAAIVAARDSIALGRRLVALKDDVPLPVDVEALRRRPPDRPGLAAFFRELEMGRLLAQFDDGVPASGPAPPASAESVEPTAGTGGPPVAMVSDTDGLDTLAKALHGAGRWAAAVLTDGAGATRADLLGLALALPDGARAYVPIGRRLLGPRAAVPEERILAALGPLFADAAVAKHAFDSKTLAVLLRVRGVEVGGLAGDPLIAAQLLDAAASQHDLGALAHAAGVAEPAPRSRWLGTGRDARRPEDIPVDEAARQLGAEAAATLALAQIQDARLATGGLSDLYRSVELPLAGVLARIETQGILLDVGRLQQLGHELDSAIAALEAEIHALAGAAFNIASRKQLADVLFVRLALPAVRRTKTGPSTDADVLEELAARHPAPAKILEYRTLTKLRSTYVEALPALVNPRTGRLHTTFHQMGAATGRLSSSDPNLQNIPVRTDLGRRIRDAFVAAPGYAIVSADYSQIELRVLAHFSEDPAFVAAFRAGDDIHRRTAAEVFGVEPAAVTAEQRRIAKAINFGLVFGQTDFGLAQALRIPRAEARAYIEKYFARYAGVHAYMARVIADARRTGESTTLLGRRRPLPGLDSPRAPERAQAERMARNTPIQGSAADLLKLAMIAVDRGLSAWPGVRFLLTVHDELLFEVRVEDVAAFSTWVKGRMEAVYALRVPVVVAVGAGPTWGAAH